MILHKFYVMNNIYLRIIYQGFVQPALDDMTARVLTLNLFSGKQTAYCQKKGHQKDYLFIQIYDSYL